MLQWNETPKTTGWPKMTLLFVYALTLPNINLIFLIISLLESGQNL